MKKSKKQKTKPVKKAAAPNPVDTKEMAELAKRINVTYADTEEMVMEAQRNGVAAIKMALECGDALNLAKEKIKYGEWAKWIAKNCKKVQMRTAQRYMELASHSARVTYFKDAQSLRQAYLVTEILPEPPPRKSLPSPQIQRQEPPVREAEIVETAVHSESAVGGGIASAPTPAAEPPPVSLVQPDTVAAPLEAATSIEPPVSKEPEVTLPWPGAESPPPAPGIGGWKRAVLMRLDLLRAETDGMGPQLTWNQYHDRVVALITEMQ